MLSYMIFLHFNLQMAKIATVLSTFTGIQTENGRILVACHVEVHMYFQCKQCDHRSANCLLNEVCKHYLLRVHALIVQ